MRTYIAVGMIAVAVCTVPTGIEQAEGRAGAATIVQPTGRMGASHVEPFTGRPSSETVRQRPVMVMVENSPKARPQTGLDRADLVYEALAEGDITRFAAVFQSRSPETVGPVRSIRPYFVEIGDGIDAMLVHAGWSQEAMNIMAERGLSHFDQVYGDSAYYWRSSDRKPPHNLYTGIGKIREGSLRKKLRTDWRGQGPLFAEQGLSMEPFSTNSAASITIPYLNGYRVEYEYDPASGLYRRYMNGAPHVDGLSGRQLSASNVLICESRHRIVDPEGRRSVDVFGPGKGMLIQGGVKKDIRWERKAGMIRAYADGIELPLLPGQTWIQMVPEGSGIVITPS